MKADTTLSRRQTLAGVAVTAAVAMVPGAARAACNDLDLYDEQSLLDALALHRRMKAAMRSWRLAMGYTRDEVAELLEMSAGAYAEIEENSPEAGDFRESGEVDNGVPLEVLARFCEQANIDVAMVWYDEITLRERSATRTFVDAALAEAPDDPDRRHEYLVRLGTALRERSSSRLCLPSALESSLAHGA